MMRASLTKTVGSSEVAKILSVGACAEAVTPLLAVPTITWVYKSTVGTFFPGAFYTLFAGIFLLNGILFVSAGKARRNGTGDATTDAEVNEEQTSENSLLS